MILRPSFTGLRGRGLLPVSTVLPMGDSITGQNYNPGTGATLKYLQGNGYAVHARQRMGSTWDFSGTLCATGGKRCDEVYALHLSDALASDAQLILDAPGTNDAVQVGYTPAMVAATRRAAWAQMRAAGKYVAALATCPLPNTYLSTAAGFYPGRVAAQNAACKAAAEADGVLWIDSSTPLETVPGSGSGIADPACFDGTLIHPNDLGAYRMGAAVAAALSTRFRFTVDPIGMGAGAMLSTPNGDFASGTTRPTGWSAPTVPSGGSISESMVVEDYGMRWWRLDAVKGASTGPFSVTNINPNAGGSPANLLVDGICLMKVESGTIGSVSCQWFKNPTVSQEAFDGPLQNGNTLSAADGVRIFRTQPFVVPSDRVQVWPVVSFIPIGGNAVVKIAYNTLRIFP